MRMLLYDAQAMNLDYVELKATSDGIPLYEKLGFTSFYEYWFREKKLE